MSRRAKRIVWIVLAVLAAIAVAAAGVAIYYTRILKDTLDRVTTPEETQSVYAVYVLQEDAAQTIGDTAGYPYGVTRSDADWERQEQALLRLEEGLGAVPAVTEYADLFALADALRQQECRAVLFNEAYRDSLAETAGYEWTQAGLRRLDTYAFSHEDDVVWEVPNDLPETFVAYISGIDTYGGLSARSRSDVNILAAVNTRTRQLCLVATPRDFYVEFAASKGQKDKLTHAGIYGVANSVDALERLYGVEIDYYVRLNFSGFVQIIDALGGIEVYSEYDFTVENIREYHRGINQLTGLEALAFARERYSFPSGDYQRAKNQMEVIRAVVQKCASPAILKNYRSVMEAIAGNVETNMPQDQILSLVRAQLASGGEWGISTQTVSGTSAYRETYSMPGHELYVILPDPQSVEAAKNSLQAVRSAG